MDFHRFANQKGGGFFETLLVLAIVAFTAYAVYNYFSHPDNAGSVRAYQNPLTK
jgi:hypothetical protein